MYDVINAFLHFPYISKIRAFLGHPRSLKFSYTFYILKDLDLAYLSS